MKDIKYTYTFQTGETGKKNFKNFQTALLRAFTREFKKMSDNECIKIAEEVSFHIEKIQIKKIRTNNKEHDYLLTLLRACSKDYTGDGVLEITLTRAGKVLKGYSLLDGEIKPNYHATRRKMKNSQHDYVYLFDLKRVYAEVLSTNLIAEFLEKHSLFKLGTLEYYQDKYKNTALSSLATKAANKTKRKKPVKVYQTNRTLNKSTKELMKTTQFLTFYKLCELDNSIDEAQLNLWEGEYKKLANSINFPDTSDHSIRFKKLGKQNAGGLYYHKQRCLLVDIKNLGTLVHEIGHLIDYKKNYSKDADFEEIKKLYKSEVLANIEALSEGEKFKKQWKSSGKYNRSYYFKNTEIFARCFELYIAASGIVTLFLKDNKNKPEYPASAELINKINNYFLSLL